MLPLPIFFQAMKAVTWWNSQIIKTGCQIVTAQVSSRQDSQDEQDFHGAVGARVTFAANHR